MSRNKLVYMAIISGALCLSASSLAIGDEIEKLERDQLGNSARPDVDPDASRGSDPSIVTQEKEQLGNSALPDVDPQASKGSDETIVKQERGGVAD